MSDSIIKLDDKNMLYHLLQSGLTGYWCDEAKIFFKESLNQFKNKKIDLNKLDSVQAQFIKVMKNMEYSHGWNSNGVSICLEMEIWDYVFSVPEICSDFLFSLGIRFDRDTLDDWIKTYHLKDKNVNIVLFFANNPEFLKWVQFRIYHLPKTLSFFDKIAQGYLTLDDDINAVREILIRETFQQMQESYKFWGNADYLKKDTSSFLDVLYEYKNRESNKENEPHQEEVASNIPVKSPVINIIDRLIELKKSPFELSDTGLKLLNFEKNENNTKYYKDYRNQLIIFGICTFISAVLSLIHPLFMIPALLSGLSLRYTIMDWKETINKPIILKTPEYHFFDSLEQSEQYLNIISLILSNQEYATRMQKFINYDLDLKTKSQRFPQAFADVFEKWDNLGNTSIYQQILDMGKLKQENLELLKELTPQLLQESENTFICQLEQEIRESQNIPQLEKWHTVLNQSSLDAMQGITVRLEKNYFLN